MEETGAACNRCRRMDDAISKWCQSKEEIFKKMPGKRVYPRKKSINLGRLQDLESKTRCKTCRDIVRAIFHHGKQVLLEATLQFSAYDDLSIYTVNNPIEADFETLPHLTLYPIQDVVPAFEVGRIFGEEIEINLLHQWINCCLTSHRDRCSSSGLPLPSHQIFLIDVEQNCLVQRPANVRYIALSYIWGDAKTAQTTKNNLDHLKKPGAINPDINQWVIPNTIRDAMRLVSLLNEKYLWVDAFCIIQDEDDTKELHLNSMASIYASSFFTIVAAGGDDANHGLRGISEKTENRNVLCDTIRFQSGQELLAYRSRAWYPENTTWDSRAWTFQEALFSRRLLIFNGLVSWVCRTDVWEEHVKKPTEDSSFSSNYVTPSLQINFAAQAPTWPDFEYWNHLVGLFACRELKYDEDVISAFAGTTFIFNRVFSGGILWGMPEMFFDYCMLWIPRNVVRRRLGSNKSSKNYLPSWSWVGWQRDIVPAHLAPLTHPPEHNNQFIDIHPMVQWYQARNPISDIIPINNSYPSLFRTYSEDRTTNIPPGWTRKLYPDSTPYYTHDEIPSERFRSPVPLINENSDQSLNNPNPYLFFKAQRAWFYIGEKLIGNILSWRSCPATLVDSEGNLVGTIRLNMDRLGELPTGDICEVVALSTGAAVSGGNYDGMLDEWNIIDLPFESGKFKFYFVMWIEWKNGIAYRKAIGTVFKGMWESQILEDIDIVLG